MTADELYLAISQLINTTSKEQECRDVAMEGRLNHRMDLLDARMDRLDAKIDEVEASLSARIDNLDAKVENLDVKVDNLDAKVDAVNDTLGGKIHLINLRLENEIIPDIKEIKNCYVSTYFRYQEGIEKWSGYK